MAYFLSLLLYLTHIYFLNESWWSKNLVTAVVQLPHHVWLFESPLTHARFPCPSPSSGVGPSSCPLHRWCHLAISSLLPSSPSAFNLSQYQGLFQWVGWLRFRRFYLLFPFTNQSILKEISPEYSLEGLMLKLKLQYFGHLMRRTDSFEKILILGKI